MVRIDRKRNRLLHDGSVRIGMRQHEARQPKRKRRLADARRSAEQPSVRDSPAFVRIEERALGALMPKERRRLTRQLSIPVVAVLAGHGAAVSAAPTRFG